MQPDAPPRESADPPTTSGTRLDPPRLGVHERVYAFLREHADQDTSQELVADEVDLSVPQVQQAIWARTRHPEASTHLEIISKGVVRWHSNTITRPTPRRRSKSTTKPKKRKPATVKSVNDVTGYYRHGVFDKLHDEYAAARMPEDATDEPVAGVVAEHTPTFLRVGVLPDGRILLIEPGSGDPFVVFVAEPFSPTREQARIRDELLNPDALVERRATVRITA